MKARQTANSLPGESPQTANRGRLRGNNALISAQPQMRPPPLCPPLTPFNINLVSNPWGRAESNFAAKCASTMSEARVLASLGANSGSFVVTDYQDSGRGRLSSRVWRSSPGMSLLFTILFRYANFAEIPAAFTLRFGLAALLGIEKAIPELKNKVFVKWPNDLLVREGGVLKKAGGILTESDGRLVFTGCGINVFQKEFPGFPKAASLTQAAGLEMPPLLREKLLQAILDCLYAEFAEPAPPWRPRLEERLAFRGRRVSFAAGSACAPSVIEGLLTGIGNHGELLLHIDGEKEARQFVTGELLW